MHAYNTLAAPKEPARHWLRLLRICSLITCIMIFFPQVNPGRVSLKISQYTSLFTTAVSYSTITNSLGLILRRGWMQPSQIYTLMAGAGATLIGILLCGAGGCMSLGNNRMRKLGSKLPMAGAGIMLIGLAVIYYAYTLVAKTDNPGRVMPQLPSGLFVFAVFALINGVCALIVNIKTPADKGARMEMSEKYRLFLMLMPVLVLTFLFCYLPIFGWRYAFYDFTVGDTLSFDKFVGFKWFKFLFSNSATRMDIVRVLRNTLVMSGLGIATSWLPVAFAVLLSEVRFPRFQKFVQTFTTIPNFISWVLIYSFALAIFSTDGFLNSFLRNVLGQANANTDYLASADWIWLKMLLWGTWKGVGWSAIIYIASIAGIDQQLYEAARVDGAGRFQSVWHITLPGLMPTYCVVLLMSVAGILSNGMDQYLVFENALNKDTIEVLDLYVYNIGIRSGRIPLSTVVGVSKSLVGITLLFMANRVSKLVRGETII